MLYTKFKGIGGNNFTIYGHGGHLGSFDHLNKFLFSHPIVSPYEIGPLVSEKTMIEACACTTSSSMSLKSHHLNATDHRHGSM